MKIINLLILGENKLINKSDKELTLLDFKMSESDLENDIIVFRNKTLKNSKNIKVEQIVHEEVVFNENQKRTILYLTNENLKEDSKHKSDNEVQTLDFDIFWKLKYQHSIIVYNNITFKNKTNIKVDALGA